MCLTLLAWPRRRWAARTNLERRERRSITSNPVKVQQQGGRKPHFQGCIYVLIYTGERSVPTLLFSSRRLTGKKRCGLHSSMRLQENIHLNPGYPGMLHAMRLSPGDRTVTNSDNRHQLTRNLHRRWRRTFNPVSKNQEQKFSLEVLSQNMDTESRPTKLINPEMSSVAGWRHMLRALDCCGLISLELIL